MMQCTGTDVHRFKLDEENRLVVTTHKSGGLRVSCMDGDVLLFEMNRVRGRDVREVGYMSDFFDSGICSSLCTL